MKKKLRNIDHIRLFSEACYELMKGNDGHLYHFAELMVEAKEMYEPIGNVPLTLVTPAAKKFLLEFEGVYNLGGIKFGKWMVHMKPFPKRYKLTKKFIKKLSAFSRRYGNKPVDMDKFPDPGIKHYAKAGRGNSPNGDAKVYFPETTQVEWEGKVGSTWALKISRREKLSFEPIEK